MQKVGNTTDTADSNGEYTNGNVAQGIPPTIINAEMLNTFQREMVNVVVGGGLDLDPSDDAQLFKSIKKINEGQSPAKLENNGYQEFPSGLIIQWGTGNTSPETNTYIVNFPKPFLKAVYQVVASPTSFSPSNYIITVGPTELNRVSIFSTGATAGNVPNTGSTIGFRWFAIGQ